jgi:hypothetical protein
MIEVFDRDGNRIDEIILSPKKVDLLARGVAVEVTYHTPQLLRYVLGEEHGTFTLGRTGERITAADPEAIRRYVRLQKRIKAVREPTNAATEKAD